MKLNPDDPRLSAWLLGELPPEEAQEVGQAVEEDDELKAEVERMLKLHQVLDEVLAAPAAGLLPKQIDEIRETGRGAVIVPMPTRGRAWRWFVSTGAAAALICGGLLIFAKMTGTRPSGGKEHAAKPALTKQDPDQADPINYLPLPGPQMPTIHIGESLSAQQASAASRKLAETQLAALRDDPEVYLKSVEKSLASAPLPELSDLPPMDRHGFVDTGFAPGVDLPVLAGRASFHWVAGYVRDRKVLPPAQTVRLEELVNAASPGIGGASRSAGGVRISVETMQCKWRPSTVIAAIEFQGADKGSRNVEARLQLNKGVVSKYRLLGYDTVHGSAGGISTKIPERASTVVMFEIEPSAHAGSMGRLGVAVGDAEKSTTSLDLDLAHNAEPSAGGSLAMLMAGFSEWLAGTEGAPDLVVLQALLREAQARNSDLKGPHAEALRLVAETLELAQKNGH